MKQKKIVNLFLALVLTLSMLFACASATAQVTEDTAAAEQLLMDLTGSYQELWPVILDSQYDPLWLDDCAALVGEENAQAAYEKLSSMVTGTILWRRGRTGLRQRRRRLRLLFHRRAGHAGI